MRPFFKTVLKATYVMLFTVVLIGCRDNKKSTGAILEESAVVTGAFQEDVDFMKKYEKDLIVLHSGKSMVAVAPRLQGRVMTSSANGMEGSSYGWINKTHYESGEINPQINVYGGEERFWLGPEGGQYSIYFEKGEDFIFENWATPKLIDLEPFEVIQQATDKVSFTKSASLTNYFGFTFNFKINRTVSVVSNKETLRVLGITSLEGIKSVGYKTENQIKNTGDKVWKKESGLLSIWMLGMYKHSETTTIVIPFVADEQKSEKAVNVYESFGELSDDRLTEKDGIAYFKGDGKYRSKIGLGPQQAKDVLGSFDAENEILTIVLYNKPKGVSDYVNSKWEIQDKPFDGDVVNSYNDGAVAGGKPLGPFYELETSSPAAALQPNSTIKHNQYTFHFEGNSVALNRIAEKTLGVSLEEITTVFK